MPTGVALATHLPDVGTEPIVQADRPWEDPERWLKSRWNYDIIGAARRKTMDQIHPE